MRVVAAGVCRSDLHIIRGATRDPLPAVLGHEGAGIVESVGPGVTAVRAGEPVVLSWARACGECRVCRGGRPHLCFEGIADGSLPGGGSRLERAGEPVHHSWGVSCFATHAVVPESMVVPVASGTDLTLAAIVGCAVTTGVGAVLHTARVTPGSSAVVIGCGGVGQAILQALRMAGADPIVAVDRGASRLQAAREAGAGQVIDVGPPAATAAGPGIDPVPAVLDLTRGGADYVFEAVGLPATVRQAIAMLGPGGAAIVVGMPPETAHVDIDLHALWSNERRIMASVYGSSNPREDFPRILRLAGEGRLDLGALVRRRYPLDRINQAFADLESDAPGRGIVVMGS